MGHFTGLKNSFHLLFFSNLFKKYSLLSAYMENTLNGEKSIKIEHISVYTGTTLKIFGTSLSILDRFD